MWAYARSGTTNSSRPATIDEETAGDFAVLNVQVEVAEDGASDDVCEVWEMNWQSVALFLDLASQWRVIARGMGGVLHFLGLDYSAAVALLSLRSRCEARKAPASRVMADLRVMEAEARPILNEASA